MSDAGIVEYEPFAASHLDGVVSVCQELGWPSYVDEAVARAAFSAPGAVTWVAVAGRDVIGLAHLLTNGVVHAHLSLVGVLPDYRRRGVARQLIAHAFRSGGGKWLDLCAEAGSEPFYRSLPHQEFSGFRIHPDEPSD